MYARQQQFDFYGVPATVADYKNATMLMIADILNDNRSTRLKKYMQLYNHNAQDAANGQLDLFSGEAASKESILNDIKSLLTNGTEKEQQRAAQEAVERRKAESVAETGAINDGSEGNGVGKTATASHENLVMFLQQFLEEAGGDMRLIELATDEEIQKLYDLYDAWEDVNDIVGEAHAANDKFLNSKNEALKKKAEDNIRKAEEASTEAYAPVQEYYHDMLDAHGIDDYIGELVDAPVEETTVADVISKAEAETEQHPTEAQKEAGNYRMGHVKLDGYDITIENPKGSVRSGKDAQGNEWSSTMNNTYGYIRGTEGVDGDHIDVFLSDDPTNGNVFVVDQVNEDGTFDEHKVMYGFSSADEARENYLANYSDGWRCGIITEVTKAEFRNWIDSSHRKTKPFSEYKSVKVEGAQKEGGLGKSENPDGDDNQGNPLNEDGTLMLEKISSIDEITDEDFSKPTRSVELPALPAAVDEAIGANGKPVIIKKNIFERNAERHADLTADDSRNILQSALYNPNLYGQNQKAKRPYNWVVINTKDKEGNNRLVLLELSPEKENAEIVHWHYIDDKGLEKIKRQAEREDGQLLILPSESEEAGALSSPTNDLSSGGKVTNNSASDQENGVNSFKISQFEYTTKRGKKINMQLVRFESELGKEQMNAAKELAKEAKGWWSKEDGGFLMRDVDSAQKLADTILGDNEAVADSQPVSLEDMQNTTEETKTPQPKKVNVESLLGELNEKGEAKLSDHVEEDGNTSGNKLVTDERYEQLKARMRKKLGQLNVGIDPEMLTIGTEMAVYHIEKGARAFVPYAKAMIEELGDAIRPYLKAFYNGARDLPEFDTNGLAEDMTPYDEVRKIDIANFDKDSTDAMATADMVVKEQNAEKQAEDSKKQISDSRNNKRKEQQKQQLDLFAEMNEQDNSISNTESNETNDVQTRSSEEGRERQQPQQDAPMGGSTGHETEGTDGRGMGGRSTRDSVSDRGRSERVARTTQSQQGLTYDAGTSGTVAKNIKTIMRNVARTTLQRLLMLELKPISRLSN